MPPSIPPVRIFALPLTRRTPTSPPLIYWHISQNAPTSSSSVTKADDLVYTQPATWIPGGVAKATAAWLSWSKKPEFKQGEKGLKEKVQEKAGEWKYWVWTKGEGVMDLYDYNEWAMKSINPSLQLKSDGVVEKDAMGVETHDHIHDDADKIPLYIPKTLSLPTPPLSAISEYLSHRTPLHKKYFIRSVIGIPAVLPFGLLPVIPNFPAFWLTWRAWSNYRAWKGAEWVERLLKEDKVEVKEDRELGDVLLSSAAFGEEKWAEERAPDETTTPAGLIYGSNPNGAENSTLKAEEVTKGAASSSSPPSSSSTRSSAPSQRVVDGATEAEGKEDEAPDSTATPESLIYHPTSSTSSSSSTDLMSPEFPSSEPILTTANLALLKEKYHFSDAEVVDLTRAIMQVKLMQEKEKVQQEVKDEREVEAGKR